jgi:diguanylate cyclase (GGDEF)-like protein
VSEPPHVEDAPQRDATGARSALRQQLWLGVAAVALMACGVALALSALKIEGALHDRYDDALSLAGKTLQAQQAAADLHRWQVRFALRIGDGGTPRQYEQAFRALMQTRAALDGLTRQLREFDAGGVTPGYIARIEAALDSLAQTNQRVHDEVAARRIEPGAARDRLLSSTEAALAQIDAALPELVAATHEHVDRMSQRAHEYGQLARHALLAVSVIALALAALLGYIGWRTMRANARLLGQLDQMAHEDPLTGAINRRGLDERLPVELARAGRIAYPLTVAMLDFDHFKRFNDRRGHQAGDRLLRGAVDAWRRHLRPMDMLVRYGGEEFTLVLPACDAEQACALIERLRPLMPERQTFSAGVAKWNGTDPPDELLRNADAALMQAKKSGRNRTIVWGHEPQITLPLTVR